jgi:predicted aspartyl protease
MRTTGANGVGRFSVGLIVANYDDMVQARHGSLDQGKVRRLTLAGIVDSGASRVVVPLGVARRLGLQSTDKVRVRYADGRTAMRSAVKDVYLEILRRNGVFTATIEPNRRSILIGAIVLEDLDLLVDCKHRRLIPRDPRYIIAEIE